MAYYPTTPQLGWQGIGVTSSVPNHDPGTIITARDPNYGQGEFIYLKGITGTSVGYLVGWGSTGGTSGGSTAALGYPSFTSVLASTTAGANPGRGGNLAVSMQSQTSGTWGWYQISGAAIMACASTGVISSTSPTVALSSTPGQISNSSFAALAQIQGMSVLTSAGVPAASQCVVYLNRPQYLGASS